MYEALSYWRMRTAIDAVSNAAGYGQEAPTRDSLEARTAGVWGLKLLVYEAFSY